ncbi:uncharacterized protein SPSK_03791 [Sporothrix schenckii 1099-18]|uniref:Uncharacterized protein n=1 Tax=Sporothrix schenckii 1099-18 TaxID=1397361 RepID=A0A0F2M1S6_SPOSC|nr:uncharacterized protein SPSK_03791 [Sporothrix schenckii 1099-18]KJR82715.1 hypothetical protein SPSK_03791 [Sporothrix schenckii 1099-18]
MALDGVPMWHLVASSFWLYYSVFGVFACGALLDQMGIIGGALPRVQRGAIPLPLPAHRVFGSHFFHDLLDVKCFGNAALGRSPDEIS